MLLILSGEGPTDIGTCEMARRSCTGENFLPGPMAVLADQILGDRLGYSILNETPLLVNYISEAGLTERERILKQNPRSVVLPGKKNARETAYFYRNAWALGEIATEIEQESQDSGVAVLFRDCDGTRSTKNGIWAKKWISIKRGFQRSGYPRGVPMLPKPKSEAWLLCAAKNPPYQNCADLEGLSGNDSSPNSAKSKLDTAFGGHQSREDLCNWLEETPFDSLQARSMPSFMAFYDRLVEAVADVLH